MERKQDPVPKDVITERVRSSPVRRRYIAPVFEELGAIAQVTGFSF